MKDNFVICIESLHVGDTGMQQNVSNQCVGGREYFCMQMNVFLGNFFFFKKF